MPAVKTRPSLAERLRSRLAAKTATVGVASTVGALDAMLPIVYEVQQTARPDKTSRG